MLKHFMKNRKAVALVLLVAMLFSIMPTAVWANEPVSATNSPIIVYVTIADAGIPVKGTDENHILRVPVYVSYDKNQNNHYDIDDVLYAAHEQYYPNGATTGYSSYSSQYGLTLAKLWGKGTENQVANAGYSVNGSAARSLEDTVQAGDHVIAYNYGEYSVYSFFDKLSVSIATGSSLSLTLQTYDENWNTIPMQNANILLDGVSSEYYTNQNGQVNILFNNAGTYIVSATTTNSALKISPICIVSVGKNTEQNNGQLNSYNGNMYALMDTIASGYTETTDEWVIMDMAVYSKANPYSYYKTSDTAKQAYINKAIQSVIDSKATETSYSKAIIALTSLGINPTKLYPVNSNTPINAVDKLNALQHSSSAWVAPYTLAAYQQGNYDTATQETELVTSILASQAEDGSWTEWWDSIQTTSNIIAGLAFYYNTDEMVKVAVDKAIAYLASAQKTDGTFDAYGYGADANTAAMVVIALSSVGINPETDTRFIKSNVSALDGLLSFALSDNSGFGYTDNTNVDDYATEQGFRALIAASQVMKTGQAYNVYDFSKNSLQPGRATGSGEVPGPSAPSSSDKITVTMSIRADNGYWIQNQSIQVAKDATVYHAFVEALKKNNMTQDGAEYGYVRSITYNGRTLGEFDQGQNSGWLYQVNSTLPNVGLLECELHDGDTILWYYTKDWTNDPQAGSYNKKEENKTEETGTTNTELIIGTIFSDVNNHWAARAIQFVYDAGLMRGVTGTDFAPEATFTRGMMATVLHRLAGMPISFGNLPFSDVADTVWYSTAVTWAYQNQLVGGISDTIYAPESPITREQLVVMLMRYAQSKGYDTTSSTSLSQYQDCSQISDYANAAMEWAVSIGLIAGRTDTTLAAQDSVTRAEVAVILERFLTMFSPETLESTEESAK